MLIPNEKIHEKQPRLNRTQKTKPKAKLTRGQEGLPTSKQPAPNTTEGFLLGDESQPMATVEKNS